MTRFALTAALLLAGLSTSATAQSGDRRFAVRGFDTVELAGSDAIRIVSGAVVSVVASGDPRGVAALAIEVRGGTLRVARRPGNWRDAGALVTVTVPSLRAVRITGSGEMRIGALTGRDFTGSLSGAGTLAVADLTVATVRFDLSGSGSIVASGRANSVAIDLAGSGRIDTHALATLAVTVDLGGSGVIVATASRTATIDAGGAGRVRVTGGPRCAIRNRGVATVRCA